MTMQGDTQTPAPIGPIGGAGRGGHRHVPLPRVVACDPQTRGKLVTAYRHAFEWTKAAARWLRRLLAADPARAWSMSALRKFFGPFSPSRLRRIVRVVRGLLDRFTHGFSDEHRRRRVTLACLPASFDRCRTGLLGNASIYATLRFCPRLLARDPASVAKVVLHEMMHQRLGVGDRRHAECTGSKHRCYREGATALVEANRYDLAARSIDNYVAFIRHIGTSGRNARPT